MNPIPCRQCIAEAMVEPTANGYKVTCSVMPDKHQVGPYRSRNYAVREWNRLQSEGKKHK